MSTMFQFIAGISLTALLLLGLAGCGSQPAASSATTAHDGPAVVLASNYPLYYFALRLADDNFTVQLPVPEDGDPAFWQPDEAAIIAMQGADAVLLNGATYEKWLPNVSLPTSVMVDTSQSFASEFIELDIKHSHSHGTEGEHAHAGTAFTTWLDMTKAIAQAEAVAQAMIDLRPAAKTVIETNLASLIKDVQQLDAALQAATATNNEQVVLASHPVYDYLARRYELSISSLLWEPETMPNADEWAQFDELKGISVEWMIYEDEPSAEVRAAVEARGVKICVFRPCGNRPPSGDFLSEMTANIERLRVVYAP